jgi:hypothetical protein
MGINTLKYSLLYQVEFFAKFQPGLVGGVTALELIHIILLINQKAFRAMIADSTILLLMMAWLGILLKKFLVTYYSKKIMAVSKYYYGCNI